MKNMIKIIVMIVFIFISFNYCFANSFIEFNGYYINLDKVVTISYYSEEHYLRIWAGHGWGKGSLSMVYIECSESEYLELLKKIKNINK